jgi:hypothetical protein
MLSGCLPGSKHGGEAKFLLNFATTGICERSYFIHPLSGSHACGMDVMSCEHGNAAYMITTSYHVHDNGNAAYT